MIFLIWGFIGLLKKVSTAAYVKEIERYNDLVRENPEESENIVSPPTAD